MKKKIIPFITLALLLCLLIGCSGNLSKEFHSSFKQFRESHIDSIDLKGKFMDSLTASKSMDLETVESWFLTLKKAEEIANTEMRKGIYISLKYAQILENLEPSDTFDNHSEDVKTGHDAKLYYVIMTQDGLAE